MGVVDAPRPPGPGRRRVSPRVTTPGRWLLAAGLAALIFWLGAYSDELFATLTRAWSWLFEALGLGGLLARVQQGTSRQVTTRSLPAMLTYGVGYVALCLLLLRLLLRDAASWALAWQLYLGTAALTAVLLLLGKLAGNVPLLYIAGRRLIDFLVSPLPVIVLLLLASPVVRRTLARH